MKPKDKAKELINEFINLLGDYQALSYAKDCALICVVDRLLELEDIEDGYRMDRVEYWEEVKQEINNYENR